MSSETVTTIDFHITAECSQECPYCWGPRDFECPVDTDIALAIVSKVKDVGARRIVFTGGDPLKRPDVATLIRHAKKVGLQVALSTTGDELSLEFLDSVGTCIDLISIPLDGSSEAVNSRTKESGHFDAVQLALSRLRSYPEIDVKICTPVTRRNIDDVPNIVALAERYAATTDARVFYNIFQTYPRAMFDAEWADLVVSDDEFRTLEERVAGTTTLRVNCLSHQTLDRLYAMIFPDGSLVVPSGRKYSSYGQFLDVTDLAATLASSEFDSAKHLLHSKGWEKLPPT
jgi:MoaA/NifB/PqqE/SkfB family radical SAM enzyme